MIPLNKELLIPFFLILLGCASAPTQAPTRYLDVPPAPLVKDYVDPVKNTDYDGLMAYVDSLEQYELLLKEHRITILQKYFKYPDNKPTNDTCVSLYYRDTLTLEDPPDLSGQDSDQALDLLTSYIERLHARVNEYNTAIERTNEIQRSLCEK